jgi:hypothetical protein
MHMQRDMSVSLSEYLTISADEKFQLNLTVEVCHNCVYVRQLKGTEIMWRSDILFLKDVSTHYISSDGLE